MKISVLIPFKSNGDEHRDDNFGQVWTEWMQFLGSSGEVVVGEDNSTPYNRSAARNDAFSRSRGDIIILADADTLFIPSRVAAAIGKIANGECAWVLPYTRYYNATAAWSQNYLRNPTGLRMDTPEPEYEHVLPGSTSGVLVVSRQAFVSVGGYNEHFVGWGWEDLAFSCALSSLFHKPERTDGFVVHLWHQRSVAENFGQPMEPFNKALYFRYADIEHDQEAMRSLIREQHGVVGAL